MIGRKSDQLMVLRERESRLQNQARFQVEPHFVRPSLPGSCDGSDADQLVWVSNLVVRFASHPVWGTGLTEIRSSQRIT